MLKTNNKAVFLDRDGVIVEDKGYTHQIENFKLLPKVIEGLKMLSGYRLFIVTNQSGIARGFYTLSDFEKFNSHLFGKLKRHGIKIEKTYYCPHKPEDGCECRKPKARLLKEAEEEFGIDLKSSFVVGDKKSDIEMGKNSGCRTVLVLSGNGIQAKDEAKPDYLARDLVEAAKWILKPTSSIL